MKMKMKHIKTPQELNETSENLNISDVISSINNYDIELLKKSLNPSIINKKIFKIFDDDKSFKNRLICQIVSSLLNNKFFYRRGEIQIYYY